jgi:hypothetical protein
MFIGCSDSKDERTTLNESDIVGKWKLTFREGYGDDAGYIIYEFNKNGTGLATEFDGGGIDSEKILTSGISTPREVSLYAYTRADTMDILYPWSYSLPSTKTRTI